LENFLRSVLGALITVQNDTVYLVHQSMKEFLKDTNSIPSAGLSLQSNESNLHITISCLIYLLFDEFENPKLLTKVMWPIYKDLADYPFFHYSSSHWSDHMKQLNDEFQKDPSFKVSLSVPCAKQKQNETGLV
jgi:hypothetical protein